MLTSEWFFMLKVLFGFWRERLPPLQINKATQLNVSPPLYVCDRASAWVSTWGNLFCLHRTKLCINVWLHGVFILLSCSFCLIRAEQTTDLFPRCSRLYLSFHKPSRAILYPKPPLNWSHVLSCELISQRDESVSQATPKFWIPASQLCHT